MLSKIKLLIGLCLISLSLQAQKDSPAKEFWNNLQSHCGKAYEGILELPEEDEAFGGKKLVMHVRYCSDTVIKIPFYVGEDKSRTWILTYKNDRISLQHDHDTKMVLKMRSIFMEEPQPTPERLIFNFFRLMNIPKK